MPHQRLLLLMIWVWLVTTITALWWDFPLQEVAQPGCRWEKRDELSWACKVNIIEWSHQKDIWKLLFSALRWTSYEHSQTPESGWHPSLDMPTAAWTPVYAIQDGEVMNAGERGWYGLSITIKHAYKWGVIYSNYSHLSEMLVKKGDKIQAKTMIGKVWCTWFSISWDPARCGNHLDFQITTDKSPSHPYGYGDCVDGYMKAVEEWTCLEKLKAYTIDPLVFFATNTDINLNYPLIAPHIIKAKAQEHAAAPTTTTPKKKTSLQDIFSRLKAQNSNVLGATDSPKETITKGLDSTVKPKETTTPVAADKNITDRTASLDIGTLSWSWNHDLSTLNTYEVATLTFTLTDRLGNTYIGNLPQAVKVTVEHSGIWSLFPNQFSMVNTDKKHLFFQTREVWSTTLVIRYGDTKVGEEKVVVK